MPESIWPTDWRWGSNLEAEMDASPPPMIKVRQELDALYIQLPRRQRSGSSARRKTLYAMAGIMLLGTLSSGVLNYAMTNNNKPSLMCVGILLSFAPYLGALFIFLRAGAGGRVVLSQRMLRMKGRKALELPLEEVQRIEIIAGGDRGRLCFHTTRGVIELFDGLFLHELEWLHHTVSRHTDRLRLQMQGEGHDTDVVAHPPAALTKLVP